MDYYPVLQDIANSLRIIAAYADLMHQKATGERIYECDSYVVGENKGGKLIYVFGAHPGLKYRVTQIYEERWGELPFHVSQIKVYVGEVAPSKEYAQQKGFLNVVPKFRVSCLPTGAKTEAEQAIYKFSRVLPVLDNREVEIHDDTPDPAPASKQAPAAKKPPAGTVLAPPPTRPWNPQQLITQLRASASSFNPDIEPLVAGWKRALIKAMNVSFGGDTNRKRFLVDVYNATSSTALTEPQWRALKQWIDLVLHQDEGGKQWIPSGMFVREAQLYAASLPATGEELLIEAAAGNPHSAYAEQ